MYLPGETLCLSDATKIGEERDKIKFKCLNFQSLTNYFYLAS